MFEVPTCKMVLLDGSEVEMTLNFGRLLQLRSKQEFSDIYRRYNTIRISDGIQDECDRLVVLYVGYLCANIDNLDECLSEDDFMFLVDPNRATLEKNFVALMLPKAPAATAKPTSEKPGKQKAG